MRPAIHRIVPVAVLPLLALGLSGCLFPGGTGGSDQIYTTNRGVRGRLAGNVEAIAADLEQVFRFLNIEWAGRSPLGDDGAEVRGYSGNDEVMVRLRPTAGAFTQVEVLVKMPAARIGAGGERWNREGARYIFSELRKWRAG